MNDKSIIFYNSKVRQVISDEYVKKLKEKSETIKTLEQISIKLANEQNILTYSEYMKLKDNANYLHRKIEDLQIEIDTWDNAREICLNIAENYE